ncbi:MAG: EI24 domain-containing protein [Hyphomicrobiales bacterium]
MIRAALLALSDMLSPGFGRVVLKSAGLSLVLFALLFAALQLAFRLLAFVPWPWVQTLLDVVASLGLIAAFFFLMAPVTAMFAGLFVDEIAAKVEARHYAGQPTGRPLSFWRGLAMGLEYGALALLSYLAAVPFFFFGVGAVALVVLNAYLLSREYFEMAAMRVMPEAEAKALRRTRAAAVFVAGVPVALLALVPIANLMVPVLATSYFTHLFRRGAMPGQASSG